jgi:hypothetical protein
MEMKSIDFAIFSLLHLSYDLNYESGVTKTRPAIAVQ